MKKCIYKIMFSIALGLLGLFMLPKKEVKALAPNFAPILIKATWEESSFQQENPYRYEYEYIVKYKIDGIINIDYLNSFEYFLVTQGVLNSIVNSMILEEIQIEDNSTVFYVRMVLSSTLINHYYGGVENSNKFFTNNSAFYVYYDVYSEGYYDGYDEGYINGRDEGYNNGYNAGKEDGYNEGKEDGYNEGYDEGKEDGMNFGREHWYDVGYQAGYGYGYDDGQFKGQQEGYDFGYTVGWNEGVSDLLKLVFIAIGTIIAVPIVFGVIAFILVRKKD